MMVDYALAPRDDPDAERRRLQRIEQYQDGPTTRILRALGVGPGWRCLDVGAGAGSIAAWLADQVTPGGAVTATDLDIGALQERCGDRVDVRRHDIRTDALPSAAFDLVHCRLLLTHLPEREAVLARLRDATRPGGLLVVGDIDFTAVRAPRPEPLFERVFRAFLAAVTAAGWAPDIGARLPDLLERHGLESVQGESWRNYHRGGRAAVSMGAAVAILALTFQRLRDLIVSATPITDRDLDSCVTRMGEPDFAIFGPTIWTAWGSRPPATARQLDPSRTMT